MEFIVGEQPVDPELLKHSGFHPLLKAPMGRRMIADARSVQSAPLAAGAQHEEDAIHRVAIRHTRIVAAKRMGFPRWQELLHLYPKLIRDTPAVVFDHKSHALSLKPSAHEKHLSSPLLR
jgi:hypothetical protein